MRFEWEVTEDAFSSQGLSSLSFSAHSWEDLGLCHFQGQVLSRTVRVRGTPKEKGRPPSVFHILLPQAGLTAQESLAGGRAKRGAISQRRMSAAVSGMQWCPEEPLAVMMMGI